MSTEAITVEYDSNNSGGRWWLDDDNWRDLERAGWEVQWGRLWFCNSEYERGPRPAYIETLCPAGECAGHRAYRSYEEAVKAGDAARFIGGLASKATRRGLSLMNAVAEWERVTGKSSTDAGCACCGQPHYFTATDGDGIHLGSGPSLRHEAHW